MASDAYITRSHEQGLGKAVLPSQSSNVFLQFCVCRIWSRVNLFLVRFVGDSMADQDSCNVLQQTQIWKSPGSIDRGRGSS